MAARELIARGYRNIGFMGGPKTATSTADRYDGFSQEMHRHPDINYSHSFAAAYSFDAGRDGMNKLLTDGPQQAYFCSDDVLSIGALSAISSAGLSVPDDIGIIGLNDMEMAGWENINLTTIRQPISQIVMSSVELMEALLDDPQRTPEARLYSCTVIERGTLRPLRA